MANTPVLHPLDARKLIRSPHHIKSLVRGCVNTKTGLKVVNAAQFFDDDHPEYSHIFDELVSSCDRCDVRIIISANDGGELLSDDFIGDLNHHGSMM